MKKLPIDEVIQELENSAVMNVGSKLTFREFLMQLALHIKDLQEGEQI